jgi:hypothetical protein
MMSTKIYIAGRVTGIPRAEAAHKFERGKKLLMQNGFNYINPMDMVPEDATPKEAMGSCCSMVTNSVKALLSKNSLPATVGYNFLMKTI